MNYGLYETYEVGHHFSKDKKRKQRKWSIINNVQEILNGDATILIINLVHYEGLTSTRNPTHIVQVLIFTER